MKVVKGDSQGSPAKRRSATFTGVVWAEPLLPPTGEVAVNDVFFEPRARTHWHSHDSGQYLEVISGAGLVCTDDGEVRAVHKGDIAWAEAGERHWHGGGPASVLTHRAVSVGETKWMEPVSDEEYEAATEALRTCGED